MSECTDERRRSFLDALDESESVNVDGWDLKFLEDTLDQTTFSEKQREQIDRMMVWHGNKLTF